MPKKVKINGPIVSDSSKWVYDLFRIPAVAPKDVAAVIDTIDAKDPDQSLEVHINSGGGSVSAGSEIYTMLMAHAQKANIVGYITGMCASAASVIAMACKNLEMSPTGELMIHNAKTSADGDKHDMNNASQLLSSTDEGIANAYMLKTGKTRAELLDLMNKTTWMNAQQALSLGFVDKIMFDEGNLLVADASTAGEVIPQQIIDAIRKMIVSNNGSLPLGDAYKIVNLKGGDPMNLEEILASLPEDQRSIVENAIADAKTQGAESAKAEAEATFSEERTTLQNEIDALKQAAPAAVVTEDDILANASPEVRAIVEAARVSEAAAKAKLQEIEDAAELTKFKNIATSFDRLPIDASVFGPIFRNFAAADQDGFDQLKALLEATNNCVAQGTLFDTVGSSNPTATEGLSAWDTIQARVKDAMAVDPKLTKQEAMTNVFRAEPELYNRYLDEMRTNAVADGSGETNE